MAIAVDCVLEIHGGGGPKGESPVWAAGEQKLYWVDIDGHRLHRFDPATGIDSERDVGEPIGCVALVEGGGFVLGLASGVHLLDAFDGGTPRRLVAPEPERQGNRLNYGRCDPFGRFWVGSMRDPASEEHRTGALYCVDGSRAQRVFDHLHVANGLAFSGDRRRMYFSDSFHTDRTIWTVAVDPDEGHLGAREVFAITEQGRPDGGCCDVDGCYWSCHIDGGRIVRYTPSGKIDRVLPMPVRWPTMCAFGGPDFATLYITSLRRGGVDSVHPDQTLAGSVFACRPGVSGFAEPRFASAGTKLAMPVDAARGAP